MLQNTRLQSNERQSPRSDGNMNDSCVKILYMRKTAITNFKLTANWLVLNFVDFLFHPQPQKFRSVWCFEFK